MDDENHTKAAEVKEEIRAKAGETRAAVKGTMEDAQKGAEKRVDRWTGSMGERAEHFAGALRAASDSLSSQGENAMAGVADDAAQRVTRVSGYLEDEDSGAMMADLLDMGRKHPRAFLGSAFAVGLAAGRFLRASSPDGNGAPSAHTDAASARADTPEARSLAGSPGARTPLYGSSDTMISAGSPGGTP